MPVRVFEHWDWEKDRGDRELSASSTLPFAHAIASYDYAGRLYRVVARNADDVLVGDSESPLEGEFVYDYFCDDSGRIVEKRALDEGGEIVVIVRFSYDDAGNMVAETGWSPAQGSPPVNG